MGSCSDLKGRRSNLKGRRSNLKGRRSDMTIVVPIWYEADKSFFAFPQFFISAYPIYINTVLKDGYIYFSIPSRGSRHTFSIQQLCIQYKIYLAYKIDIFLPFDSLFLQRLWVQKLENKNKKGIIIIFNFLVHSHNFCNNKNAKTNKLRELRWRRSLHHAGVWQWKVWRREFWRLHQ